MEWTWCRRQRVQSSLNGIPKAWHAATRPCSIETEASAGGPIASPGRVDPLDGGSVGVVHDDPSAIVGRHTGFLESEAFGVSCPSGSEQHLFRADVVLVGEHDQQLPALPLNRPHPVAEYEPHPGGGECRGQQVGDFRVP